MQRFLWIGATVFVLAIIAIIGYRQFIVQVPCGDNLILNGSFEEGNFRPIADGFMPLNTNASDLTAWTIAANANPLAWVGNGNRFSVTTPDGEHFIDLSGQFDRDIFPSMSQTVSLQAGRYELKFNIGQDAVHGFPGPVSVDVTATGAASREDTFTTETNGPNWQPITSELGARATGNVQLRFNAHTGQTKRFIGVDSVSLKRFMPVFSCP